MTRSATSTRHRSIRIVLVEQYALVRATLREIMSSESDFEVVAEVSDIQSAIELMRDDPADVVVVDTELPVASIVPALQELKRECPMCPVVLLGHRSDDEELFRAIQAGA